jgi:hypothetical protein
MKTWCERYPSSAAVVLGAFVSASSDGRVFLFSFLSFGTSPTADVETAELSQPKWHTVALENFSSLPGPAASTDSPQNACPRSSISRQISHSNQSTRCDCFMRDCNRLDGICEGLVGVGTLLALCWLQLCGRWGKGCLTRHFAHRNVRSLIIVSVIDLSCRHSVTVRRKALDDSICERSEL